MITIENIYKTFWRRQNLFSRAYPVKALENINLQLQAGEIMSILGPNGAGKTTLLKIICGLLLPDKGKVYTQGKIGYLSGELPGFYPQLNGRQNLDFFSAIYDIPENKANGEIEKYSQILEIGSLNVPFWNYSAGTKHKLALLRMLLIDPQTIIMDEPTKSLDYLSAYNFRKIVYGLAKDFNKTVILSTHSLQEAQFLNSRAAIMNNGKILSVLDKNEKNLENIYVEMVTGKNEKHL